MEKIHFPQKPSTSANCAAFLSAVPTQAKPTSHLRNIFSGAETEPIWKIFVVLFW